MSVRALLAFLLWVAAACGTAYGAPPAIVRTALSKPAAHVGETVTLELAILVPGWFNGPVELPASLDLPGAQARLSEEPGANIVETIGGVAYAGVRRYYMVTPQRAGALQIPSLRVDVAFADGERQVRTALPSQATTLQATIPAGMEGLGYFIATPRYRLQQSFDRPLKNLHVGDAIVRTLVQRGEAMSAIQLPVLKPQPADGLATYTDDPVFEEQRGERETPDVARLTQRVTYLLQRPGPHELPALRVRWLDTRSGKLETATLPAVTFDVSPAPDTASTEPALAVPSESVAEDDMTRRTGLHWSWLAGLASAIGSFLLRWQRLRRKRPLPHCGEAIPPPADR